MLMTTTLAKLIARRIPFARTAKRGLVRAICGTPTPSYYRVFLREMLANEFLKGVGIEIGALHSPLRVPDSVQVRYVDRMDVAGLRKHYPPPGARRPSCLSMDIVDDGERLDTFDEESQDFIIANHFIEHTQDPIGTLRRFMAVLKPGGVLFFALPDKRFTFDIDRPLTTLEHLIRDHEEGPEWSYIDHLYEFSRKIHKLEPDHTERHVREMIDTNYSIHFHVWTHESFLEFLFHARDRYEIPFALEARYPEPAAPGDDHHRLRKDGSLPSEPTGLVSVSVAEQSGIFLLHVAVDRPASKSGRSAAYPFLLADSIRTVNVAAAHCAMPTAWPGAGIRAAGRR